MAIKEIYIENFKSFEKESITFNNFNILIGANASGKSNLLKIFKFLRDIAAEDIDYAISMQGGMDYLRNMRIKDSQDMLVKVIYESEMEALKKTDDNNAIGVRISEGTYEFSLRAESTGNKYSVGKDQMTLIFEFTYHEKKGGKYIETGKKEEGRIVLKNVKGKLDYISNIPENLPLKENDIFPSFIKDITLESNDLLLQTPYFAPIPPFVKIFEDISIYDFDSRKPKKPVSFEGHYMLNEDGGNIAIILEQIIHDKDRRRKFYNILRDFLPYVNNIDIKKLLDNTILFLLQENYYHKMLPSFLLSDGTINLFEIIVAIYFQPKPIIILEEPERNIHPHLISKLVDMLKDASNNKQIIVTTHSPDIIKYANVNDIIMLSRNDKGDSKVRRTSQISDVKDYLDKEIGIDDLFRMDMLS